MCAFDCIKRASRSWWTCKSPRSDHTNLTAGPSSEAISFQCVLALSRWADRKNGGVLAV